MTPRCDGQIVRSPIPRGYGTVESQSSQSKVSADFFPGGPWFNSLRVDDLDETA